MGARVSVEAGGRADWARLIGLDGEHVGMTGFGASGPAKKVCDLMGLTSDNVIAAARRVMTGSVAVSRQSVRKLGRRRSVGESSSDVSSESDASSEADFILGKLKNTKRAASTISTA